MDIIHKGGAPRGVVRQSVEASDQSLNQIVGQKLPTTLHNRSAKDQAPNEGIQKIISQKKGLWANYWKRKGNIFCKIIIIIIIIEEALFVSFLKLGLFINAS